MLQDRQGQQHQRYRPGVIQRQGHLRRQQIVSLEQDQVVTKRIQYSQARQPEIIPPARAKQQRHPAGCEDNDKQAQGRCHACNQKKLEYIQVTQGYLERGRNRGPQQHCAQRKQVSLMLTGESHQGNSVPAVTTARHTVFYSKLLAGLTEENPRWQRLHEC